MPDSQVEINALLQVMANQRNAAMDDVVRLTAQLASLQAELAQQQTKLDDLTAQLAALQPKVTEPPAPAPVGEPG